ncbi:di-trans,poly-cis-decaprenylcistransferase [Mycolicibacterium duvalii]|uniref:(2Z,6E)-farnesyl diphosphate synthase n=1 Tax=Mycolicibacterium duvalii TaxID=39688 RepID=A0A7I7K1N1_9MYCO|nr:undecaprenyl diphosphate synthase family protein [Mycolicibacterium duvalii]MCV7370649.1 undecaprenyl diphosphate synthase family protein [Mycolicibacterium duvalii]PEG36851.1 di-trans,poly-cis-decaprenylcistransferase [Mycolicibacterium duvalii]BBX17967.1 UDP diphosphate synthase [Mycolicibacterium duvalii]
MTDQPAHVGLIPDGLRRWAQANDTTLAEAYLRGAQKVTQILLVLQRLGVQTVSVYNLSRANLGRSADELAAVYAASERFFREMIPAHFDPAACGVHVHGDLELLPQHYVDAAGEVEKAMSGNGFRVNILAAYDAVDELRSACARSAADGCDIADAFEIGEVDLVIRSTPEPLLSGFLPLQSQYAQLRFLSTPLNDLTEQDIEDLIADYRCFPQLRGR